MTSIYIADRRGKSLVVALSILLQKGYNITYDPPAPASSTSLPWIDVGHFPLKEYLTHELEPARIEPSKLFLKLMERI